MTIISMIIRNIIIPLIAVYLVNKWNFLYIFSFIPEDKVFEFGLSTYLCIFECFGHFILHIINSNKSKVECIFYCNNQRKNIQNIPNPRFVHDVAYIRGTIKISGKRKNLCNNSIVLNFPNWVDIQVEGE